VYVVASKYVELFRKAFVRMTDDDQDNTLSQAADRYEKEEIVLDDALDQILPQSA